MSKNKLVLWLKISCTLTLLTGDLDKKQLTYLYQSLCGNHYDMACLIIVKVKIIMCPKQSLQRMVEVHFPKCQNVPRKDDKIFQSTPQTCDIDTETEITEEKLFLAIHSFGKLKGAGLDEIKPIVLQNMGSNARQRLLNIYKASYMLSYIPSNWCKAKVIFLPKNGKEDYSQPRSYRPISLISCLAKIYEPLTSF